MARRTSVLLAGALLWLGACTEQGVTERARQAAEQIRESIPNVEEAALAQKVDGAVVKEAQEHLTRLKEYQGEVDGTLDAVTVNAIQAFQRSAGLADDGILDSRTLDRLREAAATRN